MNCAPNDVSHRAAPAPRLPRARFAANGVTAAPPAAPRAPPDLPPGVPSADWLIARIDSQKELQPSYVSDLAALTATTTPEDRAAAAKALPTRPPRLGLSKTYRSSRPSSTRVRQEGRTPARARRRPRCITEALKTKAEPFVAPMLPKIIALMVRRARLPPISDGDHPARLRRSATTRPPAPPPRPADRLPPSPRPQADKAKPVSIEATNAAKAPSACRRTRWSLSC